MSLEGELAFSSYPLLLIVFLESECKIALNHMNIFIELSVNIYFRERERERERTGEGQSEREAQNLKQAPGSELSAQSPKWGSNSQTMRS